LLTLIASQLNQELKMQSNLIICLNHSLCSTSYFNDQQNLFQELAKIIVDQNAGNGSNIQLNFGNGIRKEIVWDAYGKCEIRDIEFMDTS
jgi:hypothetical protein